MKRYLILSAVAGTLAATAAFATQPGNITTSQDPPTAAQPNYQNIVREWSTGLGVDVAGALGVGGQPSVQSYQVARSEQAHASAQGYRPDQNDDSAYDEDDDEAAGDRDTRESS